MVDGQSLFRVYEMHFVLTPELLVSLIFPQQRIKLVGVCRHQVMSDEFYLRLDFVPRYWSGNRKQYLKFEGDVSGT